MPSKQEILYAIITTGFIAGLFFGIYLVMGMDVRPESLIIQSLDLVCEAVEDLNPDNSTGCRLYILWFSVIVVIVGIVELISYFVQLGNWILGVVVYAIGFIIGLLMVLYAMVFS